MKIIAALLLLVINVNAQTDSTGSVTAGASYGHAAPMMLRMQLYESNLEKIDPLETNINYTNFAIVSAATLSAGVGLHIYQRNAWWKDKRTKFHIYNDWDYALWIDKIGHFYAGALLAHAFSAGLEASNFEAEQAAIWGSVLSFAFEMYIEIEDAYGPDWGFSPGDATADLLGASFALSQFYFPVMKNIMVKNSYFPSKKLREGRHRGGNIIDDYEGQKYWLSLRVNEFLPDKIEKYWPDFLMLAGGVGVRNLDGSGGGQREYYIALDLDAEEIPLYGPFWQFIKNTLNYIHFPMPGVRITPDTAFFVFCF